MSNPTSDSTPSTFTVTVFTRHSDDCNKRDNPQWKQCSCRKSLYLYENGKVRYVSAKTRSWEQAEKLAREEMDARDPVKKALKAIEDKEAEKARQAQAKEITIDAALDEWLAGIKRKSRSRTVQLQSLASKLRDWSREHKLSLLSEIKPPMLYAWHGQWSETAKKKRDRLAPQTQNLYVSHLHRFFKWTVEAEYLQRDPSRLVKRQKHEHIQTMPLTPEQFEEVMAATYKLDEDRYEDTPEYGRDLRAIFLLQRWTGMRLIDALMLRRSKIRSGELSITTKKTGDALERKLPKQVLDALAEIKRQEHVRPECYFWSLDCDVDNLTIVWGQRIKKLNDYLKLTDEEGKPMDFRSHMLRDTFAVELLLAGVPLEKVSRLLTHRSVKMTEQYYSPWIKRREQQLHDELQDALSTMGATF
jgi:integrase/recombinase XerD